MKRRQGMITAALALSLLLAGTASAAPLSYEDVTNSLKQDQKEAVLEEIKDGKKELTTCVEVEDTVYVAVAQTVIRELPDEGAKGVKKATFGKWFHRVGVCENGWSKVSYRDSDKKKCYGYLKDSELSDQVQVKELSETVTAAEDVNILDFPGLKDGQVLGEYIEGDTVERTGVCNADWSQVTFTNEKGKEKKGYVPTKSLEGVKEEEEKETQTAEAEIGAISPGSGEGIFVDATNKVTASSSATGQEVEGVLTGEVVAVPEGAKLLPLGTFRITHYCQCSLCCGPWANGITSTGVTARTNHTIAVDPTQIPYGSKVVINGQVYVAEDCGGAITENCIDVYVATHEEGESKGVYYTDVYLLEE